MTLKKTLKLISLVAALALVLSFASCNIFQTKLELKSFTVDRSTVKTNYLVGEEIDFSGIKATATYSDESLNKVYTFKELTITYAEDITATVGDKEVTVSFMDPNLNVKQETKVAIKVTAEPIVEPELSIAVQFEKPATLTSFDGANKINAELKYGEDGFASQFAVGDKTYVIGNENAFRFNPQFSVLTLDDTVEELANFFSVVEVSVIKGEEIVALTATAGEGNLVSFYDGETLIVTVDTYKGLYNFSADAQGLTVQISVLPSEEHYIFEAFNPIVLEAEIIKAYNVYEAWELAVIDNDNDDSREEGWDAHIWDAFKSEKGIADVVVSGIVLHADLTLTADDVPETFFMTADKDVVYTNAVTGEEITIPAGTKYLKDWSMIYRRHMAANETFAIEGNFFSIDIGDFPLIASPAVFGADGVSDDYGSDFSNATLIQFINGDETAVEEYPEISIQNLGIIGNAARNNMIDAEENLVSAGGLIFLKSTEYVKVDFDNIVGNSFFITYFVDQSSIMNVSNVKCYDSYQNAIYMWANSNLTVVDSFFNGAGGPMAIISSPEIDGVYTQPNLVATNTVFETHLSGEEIWFTAINGNSIVSSIKGLGMGLQQAGLGNYVDSKGNMNIQGLIMPEGSDAMQVITGIGAQGYLFIDETGMNRNQGAENIHWMTILQISQVAAQSGAMPPFLTVYGEDGTPYTIFYTANELAPFVDLNQTPLGQDPSHLALLEAFKAADKIVLTQGGLSVVLEFYH